jgi:3-hydroxybutyryl-CoA dehydrogenase
MQIEVLDNCSTQVDVAAIVRELAGDRVTCFRQPENIGLCGNWNSCVERARGHWVHVLPDDDAVLPGFYQSYRALIERHPESVLVYGRTVAIDGALPIAAELRAAAAEAGWRVVADAAGPWLAIGTGGGQAPRARLVAGASLHLTDPSAAGFHVIPPLDCARLAEVTATPLTDPVARERLHAFLASLGLHVEEVGDGPGLVLGRVVAQLVNEAAFLIGEGNGTPEDVDAGLELGVNHPRGPVAWSESAGLDHVLAILDGLWAELHEERFRAAPLLRRRAVIGAGLSAR